MTWSPATATRSTVFRDGRPASQWEWLVPWAVVAAAAPLVLAWTPGFSTSDTTGAVIAAAVAAVLAVAILPLADRGVDGLLFTAALASAGAAAIHFSVIKMHFDEYTLYGVFFVGSAIAQLVWPIWLLLRPRRSLLVLGAVGNAAIVVLWLLDRVGAMPIGPDASQPSPFGLGDSICSGFEVLLVAACIAALMRGRGPALQLRPRLALTVGTAALTALALLSVLAVAPSLLPPAM